ncbi:serine hydrolase [Aliidiomarina sp. Khilg15.8]
MKTTYLILLTSLLSVSATAADLEAALKARIAGDSSGACIAAAHITTEGSNTQVRQSFYCANEGDERPTASSVFEIGSISKAMQGMVVASLQQQGKIDIEAPVQDFLPDTQVPDYEGEPILLKHLLTHSSGLPRLPATLAPSDTDNPYADFTTEQLLVALEQAELATPPGENFAYSNFAAMLLSYVLSQHTGTDLDVLYQTHIFEPLKMQDSGIDVSTVQGYTADGRATSNWDFAPNMQGVGGVRSSLRDMVRFARAQLGDGPEAPVAAAQHSHQLLVEADPQPMAWGWMLYNHNDRDYLMHGGGTGGFNAMVIIDPDEGEASVVLANAALYQTGDVQALALHLLDDSIEVGEPHIISARPDDLELNDFTGSYELMPGFAIRVFIEGDDLYIQGTGQPAAVVQYKQEDVFENVQYGAEFTFERNDEGTVESMVLRQFGQTLKGDRERLD